MISTWNGYIAAIPLESGAHYDAYFFDPRTGEDYEIGQVQANVEGHWKPPQKPSMDDWVLVLEDKEQLRGLYGKGSEVNGSGL